MELQIDLENSDKATLKAFGRDHLGIALTLNMSTETMAQRIRDAAVNMGVTLISDAPPESISTAQAQAQIARGHGAPCNWDKNKWPTIMVAKSPDKGGNMPVPVGYNGRMYTVPRGVAVKVPPSVEAILRNAVRTSYDTDDETMEMIPVDAPSYPYQVITGHEFLLKDRSEAA